MRAVFEAVAHRSPYPREQFAENRWNHMVLKALFVGSALHPIQGLEERANPALARMLCDYAHERWAAGGRSAPSSGAASALMPMPRRSRTCSACSRPAMRPSARPRRWRWLPVPTQGQEAARHGSRSGCGRRARRTYLGASRPGALSRPSANSSGPGRPAMAERRDGGPANGDRPAWLMRARRGLSASGPGRRRRCGLGRRGPRQAARRPRSRRCRPDPRSRGLRPDRSARSARA